MSGVPWDRFSRCFSSGSGLHGVGLAGLDIEQAHLIWANGCGSFYRKNREEVSDVIL